MCKAFSCIVGSDAKVTWKLGMDSHTDLLELTDYKDDTADPKAMEFARVEITPDNRDYLFPDKWKLKIDQAIVPAWWSEKYTTAAHKARTEWLTALDKILVRKPIVYPFKIDAPQVTAEHIAWLKEWSAVWDSVGDSVGASVWDSVWASVRDSVWDSVGDSVWDSVRDSVWASVWASVRDSVGDSVGASVGASVGDSVGASVWAYIGSFFNLSELSKFYPAVKLWESGLVPSFDGKTWRLHAGPKATAVYEIAQTDLRK